MVLLIKLLPVNIRFRIFGLFKSMSNGTLQKMAKIRDSCSSCRKIKKMKHDFDNNLKGQTSVTPNLCANKEATMFPSL